MAKTSKPAVIIILIMVIGLSYVLINWDGIIKKLSQPEVKKEREKWEKVVKELETERTTEKETLDKQPEVSEQLFGPEIPPPPERKAVDCGQLQNRLINFFAYLDQKGYLTKYRINSTAQDHYNHLMTELSQRPPFGSEVGLNWETLVVNKVHLFRVLGRKNIRVAKELLAEEGGNLEIILKEFHEYFSAANLCSGQEILAPAPQVRYEYAAFFLNTFGGRSYLLRRSSRVRILATYYSVLTLHEANEKVLNRHGINILPHLNHIIEEISARNDLIYQKEYLDNLRKIKSEYPYSSNAME